MEGWRGEGGGGDGSRCCGGGERGGGGGSGPPPFLDDIICEQPPILSLYFQFCIKLDRVGSMGNGPFTD